MELLALLKCKYGTLLGAKKNLPLPLHGLREGLFGGSEIDLNIGVALCDSFGKMLKYLCPCIFVVLVHYIFITSYIVSLSNLCKMLSLHPFQNYVKKGKKMRQHFTQINKRMMQISPGK